MNENTKEKNKIIKFNLEFLPIDPCYNRSQSCLSFWENDFDNIIDDKFKISNGIKQFMNKSNQDIFMIYHMTKHLFKKNHTLIFIPIYDIDNFYCCNIIEIPFNNIKPISIYKFNLDFYNMEFIKGYPMNENNYVQIFSSLLQNTLDSFNRYFHEKFKYYDLCHCFQLVDIVFTNNINRDNILVRLPNLHPIDIVGFKKLIFEYKCE